MPATVRAKSQDSFHSPAWRRTLRRRLLAWYRRHARDLPWRRTRDPYAIWVSEIMLQQTQVATVERYFPCFLAAFPTVGAMAAAPEQKILRLWEGLGYYRRARQLHAAAKKIVADHAGRLPADLESLQQLPGIGRYTAGAIRSIAFDLPAPILEANTVRLLCRLLAFRGDPTSGAGKTLLWRTAEQLLPQQNASQFNQALMELGSLICSPRNPQCSQCPLESLCPTHLAGLQHRIPAPRRQPIAENCHEAAVLIVRRGRILLRKCKPTERWAGLWDFPRFTLPESIKPRPLVAQDTQQEIVRNVQRLTGFTVSQPRHFVTLQHSVTRFRITLNCFTANCEQRIQNGAASSNGKGHGELRWVKPDELDDYPLNTTGRKLARLWRKQAAC
jgi:A/G-specific adenine glycosylase